MSDQDKTAQAQEPQVDDAKIVIICDGDSPVPKYIDFHKISPFHLLALGEWLSLKGRQMIALAENAERNAGGIVTPDMDEETLRRIVGVGKR